MVRNNDDGAADGGGLARSSSSSSSSRACEKKEFQKVLSRLMSNDREFNRLVLDGDGVCSFICDNMDSFVESMRVNTTVTSVKLHQKWSAMDFEGNHEEYESFCCVVARGLGVLQNLKRLEFESKFWDNAKSLSILLEHVSKITSLEITIIDDGEQPESLDKAFGNLTLLEKLVVKFDYTRIYNPFPCLATSGAVPNLRSITLQRNKISTTNDLLEPLNTLKIHGSKNLSEIVIRDFKFDAEHNLALADTIANNPNLKTLVVQKCEFVTENSYILGQQLGNTTSLEHLSWGCPDDFQIYAGLSSLLQGNKNLKVFILRRMASSCFYSSTHTSGLQFLLSGFKFMGKSLQVLKLFGYEWTEALGQCLSDYIGETGSLVSLVLGGKFTDETFHQIFEGVALNTSLKDLDFETGCTAAHGLVQAIEPLKENKTLEKLAIFCPNDTAEALVGCMSKLMNTRIKTFRLGGSKPSLSIQQGKAVLEALQQNYTLSECPFDIDADGHNQKKKDIMERVQIIFKLNCAGRQYILEEKGSKQKAITLLAKVTDDLDCTFFHMVENPELCELERPEAIRRFNALSFVRCRRLALVEGKLMQLMEPSNFAKLDEGTKQGILTSFNVLEQAERQYDSVLQTLEEEVGTVLQPAKEN